jgi:hypothetical protein
VDLRKIFVEFELNYVAYMERASKEWQTLENMEYLCKDKVS